MGGDKIGYMGLTSSSCGPGGGSKRVIEIFVEGLERINSVKYDICGTVLYFLHCPETLLVQCVLSFVRVRPSLCACVS